MNDSNDCLKEAKTSHLSCVTKLSEWILRPREERTAHIDLTTPCELGKAWRKSTFLDFHNLEDDVPHWKKARVERCHLCENHSTNGNCTNPLHVYIGTVRENKMDQPLEVLVESGRRLGTMKRTEETKQKMSRSAKARKDYSGSAKNKKEVWLERVKDGHIFWFESRIHAAEVLGVNCGNLSQLLSGKRQNCGGYRVHSWGDSP